MKINNYELDNSAIGILKFIKEYRTNYTVIDSQPDKNYEILMNIRLGSYSPIITGLSEKVKFQGIRDSKKIFQKEVLKLVKHNILILKKDYYYCINPEFKNEIFDTDWDTILPKKVKMSVQAIELLVSLAQEKEKGNQSIHTNTIKQEFRNSQSLLKKFLIPQEYVILTDYNKKPLNLGSIYYGDRCLTANVGKRQLVANIHSNNEGIDFLSANGYKAFLDTPNEELKASFIKDNDKLFEILDIYELKYELKSNEDNDIKIFLEYKSFTLYHKFLKYISKNKELTKNINFILNQK